VCDQHPNGFDEKITLDFHSPYGCSKGAADQYMLDYARIFGLKTIVFRHSSMYGGRQFATYDQGWVGWFCQKADEAAKGSKQKFTISGNGKQVRDVLHAEDIVSLYFSALSNIESVSGNAFNIGGGIEASLSLLELFTLLETITGIPLSYVKLPPRESDQKVFVADVSKANQLLGCQPKVSSRDGVGRMMELVSRNK
jgi:CDP-paratose 2-epimerase